MCSSYAFIHARMRSCNTHHLHVCKHVQVREPHICFRNHLRCFKVKLTPSVKSTGATTTLAGLQFSTPRKDVTNRSRSMWQLIFIWQAKSAQAIQAKLWACKHLSPYLHRTQDLSLRHYATPRRQIWQYLWHKADGEVRLWQFGLDNEGVIRCFRDEMISPPFEYEWKTARSLLCNYHCKNVRLFLHNLLHTIICDTKSKITGLWFNHD